MPTRHLSSPARLRLLLTASMSALLAACGGGGGDGTEETGNTPDQQAQAAGTPVNWSDPKTWGGTVPPNGASVVIPAGKTVVLDTATAKLADLRIDGVLTFAEKDVSITSGAITVSGTMQAGTAAAPFTHRATITLTGAPGGTDGVSRGLRVTGGKLLLYAVSPQPAWTKLNQHAEIGAKQFQLKQNVDWKSGDQIIVAPTDHYGLASTEAFTLASAASGATVKTTAGLVKSRWGKLQYPTSKGMSLTPEANYTPPATPAPTSLDERAAVGNLTRRIVIQGADDDAWKNQGYGAHVMVMSLKSQVQIDGVEFHRVGQAGQLGRYPMHWHTLSYDLGTGAELGDVTGHYIRNSAIWDSANRCVVIHATNGVSVQNNICYDIKGHAFFLEDAVERRNIFDGNLALKMRAPTSKNLLKIHEGPEVFQAGPSGFWMTNPDNQVTNNLAGDAQGNGIWLSFPMHPLGLSRSVKLWPRYTPLGVIENNTVHSARGPGMLLEWVPVDDNVAHPETTLGSLASQRYVPMKKGKPCLDGGGNPYDVCPDDELRLTIKRTTSFKNRDGAYRNRVTKPDYLEWTVADNVGLAFAGAAQEGTIQRGLIVGTSLNHSDGKYPSGAALPAGVATYHSTVAIKNNHFIDIPFVDGKTSGAFSAEDYYIAAVERGKARNGGNRLTNASPGYRNLQPGLTQNHLPSENWALSGAIWDTEGQWGQKNWYTVPDTPFLTIGANCVDAKPAGRNGKSCEGEYFGIESIQTDFDSSRYEFAAAINASRQDSNGNEIASWRIENGYTRYVNADVAKKYACDTRVTPPPGNFCSWQLGHMRHFAARPSGRYVLSFPGWPSAKWLAFNISNASGAEDKFMMAVKFDGRLTAAAYFVAGSQWDRETGSFDPNYLKRTNVRPLAPAANLAAVQASSGDKFWQDKANNLVWFKYQGGLPFPGLDGLPKNSDEDLYRMYSAVVYPKDTCTGAGSLSACLARIKALNLP
ncbi:G8 domain-containing protein [Ideonella sp. DXS29W]|uniref:G8 domain-containing protein n=1 Tax=Ideonella lacteola TaxID=2984193 RepID=A0ABU9BVF3_9BURK